MRSEACSPKKLVSQEARKCLFFLEIEGKANLPNPLAPPSLCEVHVPFNDANIVSGGSGTK